MKSALLESALPVSTAAPSRADVVCFVGAVGRTSRPVSGELAGWLEERGWQAREDLLHQPVPVTGPREFEEWFVAARPGGGLSWLGAAVRTFFAQGGMRCLVVRTGDPVPAGAPRTAEAREAGRAVLLPARPGAMRGDTAGRGGAAAGPGRGLEVLRGLPEVAMVCLPDLPELASDAEPGNAVPPSCTTAGYVWWREAVHDASCWVRAWRPDVQLVLALPRPAEDEAMVGAGGRGVLGMLESPPVHALDRPLEMGGIATEVLQLVFPWVRGVVEEGAAGRRGWVPPDGVLAGVLARSIVGRGAHESVGWMPLRGGLEVDEALAAGELTWAAPGEGQRRLVERVSLLARSAGGARVLSDVTTSLRWEHRPAGVGRLLAAIVRAARSAAGELGCEGPGLLARARLRQRIEEVLLDLYLVGALAGRRSGADWEVHCGDQPGGGVHVVVRCHPAQPVGPVSVEVVLREGMVVRQGVA